MLVRLLSVFGWRVLRFTNDQVENNLDAVIATIEDVMESAEF